MTINGVVWNQIPEDVKQLLSSEVGHRASKESLLTIRGLVEQWPKQLKESGRSEKDEDFPRNASARRLREALERSLEAWQGHSGGLLKVIIDPYNYRPYLYCI